MSPFHVLSSTRLAPVAPVCPSLALPVASKRTYVARLRRALLAGGRTEVAMTSGEAASVAMWRSKGLSKADACAIVFGARP